jgi:YidC/Oxa1 family membrane protein insertase
VFQVLADALAFFYEIWPSYGGAIVLFTLAIMLILSPLAIKSTRSMIRMQRLQPEMKKLQAKYKDDREALNREMMAFYKANNVNPFSSCLPLLLQMPVFIVLYRVLHGLTKMGSDGTFDPAYLDHNSSLYQDLTTQDKMMSFGMDLSRSPLEALQDGFLGALPYVVLVAIVVVTSFVQQRQIQGRNPSANMNPQQQMIGRIMPFIFIPISVSLPAGVVVYFAVSNLVRVGQQALVTKLEYSGKDDEGTRTPKVREAEATPKENPKGKGTTPKPGGSKPVVGGNGSGGGKPPANGARRSGASAGSGAARSRNRKRKRK